MALAPRTRVRLSILAVAVPLAIAVGTVYSLFLHGDLVLALADGGVIGGFICTVLLSSRLFGPTLTLVRRMRRLPVALVMLASALEILLVVLAGLAVGRVSSALVRGVPVEIGYQVSSVVFSLAVSAVFVAGTTVDRILGGQVLFGLLTGRYLRPRREQRAFLFGDLAGSTHLAESLGDERFHRFLDEVFCALAEPVARYRGTIYRYVGDETIVTWRLHAGGHALRALHCALACCEVLAQQAPRFEAAYGVRPRMRFALHTGPVVTGEMGDLKREIVYLGDTVNTASRLVELAKQVDRDLLLSGALLDRVELPEGLAVQPIESVVLRGKSQAVRVYAAAPSDASVGRAA